MLSQEHSTLLWVTAAAASLKGKGKRFDEGAIFHIAPFKLKMEIFSQ